MMIDVNMQGSSRPSLRACCYGLIIADGNLQKARKSVADATAEYGNEAFRMSTECQNTT